MGKAIFYSIWLGATAWSLLQRRRDRQRTPSQRVWRRESYRKARTKPLVAAELIAMATGSVLLLFTDHWLLGLCALAVMSALVAVEESRRRRLVGDGRALTR